MISFSNDLLRDLPNATSREWLESNGIGGFACSTIIGLNTRRYHGLLTAATRPPAGRMVLLSKMEETVIIDGKAVDLSSNQYAGVIHPLGYYFLEGFRLDPFPSFTFVVKGVRIEKTVFMVHGQNATVIQYRVRDQGRHSVHLELRPLIASRDYHSLTHENPALNRDVQHHHATLSSICPYGDNPTLYFAHDANELNTQGYWYRNFEYAVERERGLDAVEDLYNPMAFRFDVSTRTSANIITATDIVDVASADALRQQEIDRRSQIVSNAPSKDDFVRTLTAAADQYIVARGDQRTVIAGYPWFTDWGRDTMIALPGLTLVTGRPEIARSILCEFARHVDQGMLPNRFPDAGETPEYNTIDATFWYFEAVRSFLHYTGDYTFVAEHLYDVLTDIVDWHVRGTRYGIHMDADGLIASNDPGVQLTWMDAKIGDHVVTPRNGKPVEIQALWYNALRTMEDVANKQVRHDDEQKYSEMADRVRKSFNELFWNEDAGCLYDTVNDSARDGTIRPNQILAVSLHHTMLGKESARNVVDLVERELLTPYGLRSLSPADNGYCGRYEGDPRARDAAYHQGTVWAWLLGPFIDAYFKVNGTGKAVRDRVRKLLEVLSTHLNEAGLGHISEIFDGDRPHLPRGCFAQAWSVAEVLRAVVENGLAAKTPKLKKAAKGR